MDSINKKNEHNIKLYILGLLYFEDDTKKGVILSRKELSAVGWMFASSIFGDTKPDVGEDDTYFKFKLSKSYNPVEFKKFIGNSLPEVIKEIQFGYYHHRAIFSIKFKQNTKLHVLRNARYKLHELIREKCFNRFTDCELTGYTFKGAKQSPVVIKYIYSYSLAVIPNGRTVIDFEKDDIRNIDYDDIFTARSTTFGLYLPEYRSFLKQRKHFVRISVPSTVIYADGESVRPELFDNIIDAIYYGGLYQKVLIDQQEAFTQGSEFKAVDTWTNDLLIRCLDILTNIVSSNEKSEMSVHLKRLALIAGLITGITAIIVSVTISYLFR